MVAASRRLLQFAREQEEGTFRSVTVTRHHKPVLVIVPFTEMPEELIERARAAIATLENPEVVAVLFQALDTFIGCQ